MRKQGINHILLISRLIVALILLSGCRGGDDPSCTAPFAVSFTAVGVGVTVSTRSETSPLPSGTTLRILAFRRTGTAADLSADEYRGEGTYEVPSDEGGGILRAVSPLLLSAGTYDFYALTPALAVTRGSNGAGNTYAVQVENGTDYATSLTESVTVSATSPSVNLDALMRRCTKVTFVLSPKGDNITAVNISSAGITNMTDAPVTGGLNEALDVSGLTQTTEVSVSDFTAPDSSQPLVQESSTVVLPREAGAFSFKMVVEYDNSGKTTELSADLAFSAGTHYTFTVRMRGERADLVLSVSPWIDSTDFSTDIGGPDVIEIVIGGWTDVYWDSSNTDTGGGNSVLVVSGWEANPAWNDEFGRYPGLGVVCTTWQDVLWTSHSGTGGGNAGLVPDNWNTIHTTDGTNGGSLGGE